MARAGRDDARTGEFERDLGHGPADDGTRRRGDDQRDLKAWLADELDGLGQLAIIPPGTRLAEGAVHLDIDRLDKGAFTAHGGIDAPAEGRLVAKRETDHETWRRLEELGAEARAR